ncbi:MAG TPA: hypothetical protein VJJ52_06970 [Candidatus Nanoarchaeia archaeon]|nr:hypothetical protein [Candidatus Nanoarchaeia archaeon]
MLKEESLEELIENQKVKEIIAKATELSFFVPIYIQEIIRMKLRKAKVDLPLPNLVQNFYYNHFGDFGDGYLLALGSDYGIKLGIDGIARIIEAKKGSDHWLYTRLKSFRNNENLTGILSGLTASGAVVFAESNGILNRPDYSDIPSGILGILTYLCVRRLIEKSFRWALKKDKLNDNNYNS